MRQALSDTAELLESLVQQTLALMNSGARLDEVIHTVAPPARLMERPYLRPVYDEPEFIVRTVWRLYGGWWDGNPATLKPAPERALALELAELAGGAGVLADRALALLDGRAPDRAGDPGGSTRGGPGDDACGWPATWPSWPGWPHPDDPGVQQVAPHRLHPAGRRGVVDHGPRGVLLGRTGVRRTALGDGPAPDGRRSARSWAPPLNWEFARPKPGRRLNF